MADKDLAERIQAYKTTIRQLPDSDDHVSIQQTVERLERLHFAPTVMFPTAKFTAFTKTDMLAEIDRIANLTEQAIRESGVVISQDVQETKLEHIGLLVYHFKLLTRLRRDDPAAWDEIDELYGDD